MHNDVWDLDVASQPVLFSLRRGGKEIAAVVQSTKTSHLFILDRETGEPLFPVEERPVPQGGEADFVLCEIGGTVGDIEGLPFLEAIRQLGNQWAASGWCSSI